MASYAQEGGSAFYVNVNVNVIFESVEAYFTGRRATSLLAPGWPLLLLLRISATKAANPGRKPVVPVCP